MSELFANNRQVTVQFKDASFAKSAIAIYDLSGRMIGSYKNETALSLAFPIQQTGIYIVKIENQHGVMTQKLFVE